MTKHAKAGENPRQVMMEIDANRNPFEIFNTWMDEAKIHPQIREATAMTLATLGTDGTLSTRVVLCKEWSEAGFVFYTSYQSRKGLDLAFNPVAAAAFYWDPLFRQVNICGRAQKISRERSLKYWATRARDSQISQYVSRQSQEVASRAVMEHEWREADEKFRGQPIPCPEHWGGFELQAERLEFWAGRPGRFHDRYAFEKAGERWTFRRLYP